MASLGAAADGGNSTTASQADRDRAAAAADPVAAAATPAAAAAEPVPPERPWGDASLQQLRAALQLFADERDWQQYHSPRNLLLALMGECGELAEIFQWRGEVAPGLPGFTADERRHVGEELSDVLFYLVRLADACGVDLAAAAQRKLQLNAAKYPASRCRGRSDKYTAYSGDALQAGHAAAVGEGGTHAAAGAAQPGPA